MDADPDTATPPDVAQVKPAHAHLYELFVETARSIHRYIPLQRAILVVARDHYRDLIAVAGWSQSDRDGACTRTLSLVLPAENSLFAQVAAQRFGFSDDYFGIFSGNSIERRLLIDSQTRSYVIWPLRVEASLIGLVGFSSEFPGAFTEIDAIDPERTLAPLTSEMAHLRVERRL
jgi:hypothetical protein